MKKLTFCMLIILTLTLLFGCNKKEEYKADMNLVGAWQIDDEQFTEYYIFTEDSKVKIVRGSVCFEGDAIFSSGLYASDFYYMSGELDYKVEGDRVTFDDGAGTMQVLKKARYSAPVLSQYDDFDVSNPLVGTWYNEEYHDSYTFNADGTAQYYMQADELSYVSYIDYTYTVRDGSVYFTYDAGQGSQEISEAFKINGDILNIENTGEYTRQ